MRKAPQTKPQNQTTILQNCDKELADLDIDITEWHGHIAALEEKLHKLQTRANSRASQKQEARQERACAEEVRVAANLSLRLARHTSGEQDAITAHTAARKEFESASRTLIDIEIACATEEGLDTSDRNDLQVQLSSSNEMLQLRFEERARLLQAKQQAFEQRGREEAQSLAMAFVSLQDQQSGYEQSLAFIQAQRATLSEQAQERLSEYPDHLAAIMREHVPYTDDVTALLESNLAFRREIAKHGGELLGLLERNAIPVRWMKTVELTEGQNYFHHQTIANIEAHLQAHIEEKRP